MPQNHRSAVIFLPGISETRLDQSSVGLAKRIAVAIGLSTERRSAAFQIEERGELAYGETYTAGWSTIKRSVDSEHETSLDVFTINQVPKLISKHTSGPAWPRFVEVAIQLIVNTPKLRHLARRSTGSNRKGLVAVYASAVLSLLAVYFLLLTLWQSPPLYWKHSRHSRDPHTRSWS